NNECYLEYAEMKKEKEISSMFYISCFYTISFNIFSISLCSQIYQFKRMFFSSHIKGNCVETRYIKHATNFFNNECYLEYAEMKKEKEISKVFSTLNFSIDSLLD
ncbi:hypothetical protein ACT453_31890, partial [Bacillus sp. D-CC]